MARRASTVLPLTLLLTLGVGCQAQGQPRDPAAEHAIPPFQVPPIREGTTYQRLLVFGDWGTGREDQRRVARAMSRKAARDGLDLLLTTGDNFYPAGVRSADDPRWRTDFEQVYDLPGLRGVPVRPTLGNHDHGGSVEAQVAYSERSARWRMPARYYTFTLPLGGGRFAQLFALDTDPLRKGRDPEQLRWLERELQDSEARWKLVYGHHPLYSHSRRPYDLRLIALLEPLFVRHRVDVYLAGHDHTLEMLAPRQGVHYVISGAGAGPDKAYDVRWTEHSRYAATGGGFVCLRLSRDELVIEFVRLDGETQYAHVVVKQGAGPY